MIGTVRLHRCLVLLLRAPARHGNPLLPMQPNTHAVTQMTLPTIRTAPVPTVISRTCSPDRVGRADIIYPGTQRPG